MEQLHSDLDRQFRDLERELAGLAHKYLHDINLTYVIRLWKVERPEPSDILFRFDHYENALRYFLLKFFEGPMGGMIHIPRRQGERAEVIDPRSLDPFIPMREEQAEMLNVFLEPILNVLRPVQPSFYRLDCQGYRKYQKKLNPCLDIEMLAFSVGDSWFIMLGECYD